MLTAILTCGLATGFVSCSSNDDDTPDETPAVNKNEAAKAEVTYMVSVGANTLELANVTVTYLDEKQQEQTYQMTDTVWKLKRTLLAADMPAEFSLKVNFEQRYDVTAEADHKYSFGCFSRIPFIVYNAAGDVICEHPGAVAVSERSGFPMLTGSELNGWWLTYSLGLNPEKLINFDKKTLIVQTNRSVFNDMSYDYPYKP